MVYFAIKDERDTEPVVEFCLERGHEDARINIIASYKGGMKYIAAILPTGKLVRYTGATTIGISTDTQGRINMEDE